MLHHRRNPPPPHREKPADNPLGSPPGCEGTLPRGTRFAIKGQVRALIDRTGLARAADITGLSTSQLARYGSPHEAADAPVWVVLALEIETGAPLVSDLMAEAHGLRLSGDVPGEAPGCVTDALFDLQSEIAEVAHRIAQALRDGTICPREAAAIVSALADLRDVKHDALRLLSEIIENSVEVRR